MKKILAIVLALVMVLAMAVPAFAADEYTAFVMFTTSGWWPSAMEAADHNSVTVTGDGTYSIETDQLAGSANAFVFCVDIVGLHADYPDATAVLDSIEVDGNAVDFNADAVLYGDIEENGNYRIEIRNEYGDTKDTVINGTTFAIGSTLKVTFTVSGMGGAAPADDAAAPVEDGTAADNNTVEPETTETAPETNEAPATTEAPAKTETKAPSTGIALAVVPAVVAMAAVAVSKKR